MGEYTQQVEMGALGDNPSPVIPEQLYKLLQIWELPVSQRGFWASKSEEDEEHPRRTNTSL
jgi:hypothetical protein